MTLTKRQQEAIAEASRDRLSFAARCEPVLSFDGRVFAQGAEDFRDFADGGLAEECSYGEEDGVAVVLTATVLGRLSPKEYEQTECRVDWLVTRDDGSVETCNGFLGKIQDVFRRGPYTDIVAATEGAEASETPVGESSADDREFAGFRPDTVLFDVLSRLTGYAGVEIPRIPEPVLDARDEPFSWTRYVGEAVEWVESQAQVKAADAPWNVASAYALRPAEGEAVWDAAEGRDLGVGELSDGTPEGERFARVVVTRLEGEGSETEGEETKLAEAKVDNGDRRVNPRSVKFLPYDAATEGEGEDRRSAYAVAYEEAGRLSGLPSQLSVPLNYPPFWLSRGPSMSASSREYTTSSVVSLSYLMRLDKVVVDVVGKKGSVSGEGRVLSTTEEALDAPRFRAPGGVARALWGLNPSGDLYADDSTGWLYHDEEGCLMATDDAPIAENANGELVFVDA